MQAGDANVAEVYQGWINNHEAIQKQEGDLNYAYASQWGEDNYTKQTQAGFGNWADSYQGALEML